MRLRLNVNVIESATKSPRGQKEEVPVTPTTDNSFPACQWIRIRTIATDYTYSIDHSVEKFGRGQYS